MPMKDTLFLLRPGFADPKAGDSSFYCPGCAQLEGLLSYAPQLRGLLDVVYVDFPRPRAQLIELLGEAHQGCPVLVLGEAPAFAVAGLEQVASRYVAKDPTVIAAYLAAKHGTPVPHP
jgi:hypothetical protein